jgi:hypothetical protein
VLLARPGRSEGVISLSFPVGALFSFALPQTSFDARVVLADALPQRYTFIFNTDFLLHDRHLFVYVCAPPCLLGTYADLNASD